MNKLSIIAVALAAVVTPAAAQSTMPTEYRGQWCVVDRGDFYVPRKQVSANNCDLDTAIKLTATEIEFEDGACKLTRVKTQIVPNIGDGNVVHGKVNLPTGTFTCDGTRRVLFYFSNGKGPQGWKERRLFLENVDS